MFGVTNGTITLDKDAIVCTGSVSGDVSAGTVVCRTGELSYEVYEGMIIQHAVAANRYIFIHPGTYTLTSSLDITLSNITIQGSGRPTIITTATDNLDIILAHGAGAAELTNIILRDFLVRGFLAGAMNDLGISWEFVDDSKIINVWSETNGESGIKLNNCDNDEIENSHSHSNNQMGCSITGSTLILISNSFFNSNTRPGLAMGNSADCTLNAVTCSSNDSGGNTYSGISLDEGVDRIVIVKGRCDANGLHGLEAIYGINHLSITGGEFSNQNTGDGISLRSWVTAGQSVLYSDITGAICYNNAGNGIQIRGYRLGTANYNTICGVVCESNTGAGILIVGEFDAGNAGHADHNIVTGSTCTNNGGAGVQILLVGLGYADHNKVQNNRLTGNTGPCISDGGTNTELAAYVVPFSDGFDPQDSGYLIDANTEFALAWARLPVEVQQVLRMKIYARAVILSAAAMRLEINVNGGASNEAFNTHATAAPNTPSTTINFAADDVIFWTLTSAQITALLGGDSVEVKVLHEAAGNGDVITNAFLRTVEFDYV